MTAMSKDELAAMPVEFKLNGKDVVGYASETIIQTAKRHGVEIPHLCYKEGMRPDGNCRACVKYPAQQLHWHRCWRTGLIRSTPAARNTATPLKSNNPPAIWL